MADLQDDPHTAPAAVGPGSLGAEDVPATPAVAAGALERAAALLSVHPVADGCNTLVWTLRQSPYHDIDTPDGGVDTDIPRLRAGGVGAQFWSLLVPSGRARESADADQVVSDTLEQIDVALTLMRRYPDSLRLALSAEDLADARNRGRIASFLGPVPGRTLTDSLGPLRAFHALGVRILAPAGAPWAQDGLTAFGHEVVRETNRLAMLLDLTGCSPVAACQIAGASKAPVIISNTAAAALNPHPGNVTDEVLLALREAGGLAMVTFDTARTGDSLHAVADHVDHVRAVAGPHCVGLGAAFGAEPGIPRPAGLTDPSGYPRLVAELLDRGWPEADVALLTWDNAQRVIRDAEFTARAAQHRRTP
ncbi:MULTISPECIES: membrane dipeptidase [unclassified Streptomyces]|uniref:membrane dipeptidase n=1 Tax=unclassified Streptomyces TaxID=2593676 RepID=UPI001BE4FC3E|nr:MULTISPECIES: membrane dipeptidase [unclassified Streptomyces]MBT2404547.1 membrane dipeptidase [Streptomyces sp. ISL-21]MBT2459134.1 membrane dipeptidase [Streptomyces sp. ISL-86]MBT2612725.1 membrane dipeptidase [Streptomyces sp. ISL-87]